VPAYGVSQNGIFKFTGGARFPRIDVNGRPYTGIACDATGSTVVAITSSVGAYMSINSGASFTAANLPAETFRGVTVSANGSVIYIASIQSSNTLNRGIVYTCRSSLHADTIVCSSPLFSCPLCFITGTTASSYSLTLLLMRPLSFDNRRPGSELVHGDWDYSSYQELDYYRNHT